MSSSKKVLGNSQRGPRSEVKFSVESDYPYKMFHLLGDMMLVIYVFALITKHSKYTVKDTVSHEDQLISIFAGFTVTAINVCHQKSKSK